jgi:hypothetical protein
MIKRYTEEEFNSAKSRDLLKLECEYCHLPFNAKKHDIQWAIKRSNVNYLKLWGKECRTNLQDTKKIVFCHLCKTPIKRQPRIIGKSKFIFCSNSCVAKYWNVNKTWGWPRSKLEMWIKKQLEILYPNLHIEYNNRMIINAELDIYIPSLKLAFELNGIFHYEPIYGKEQLGKVQNNDKRKFQACIEQEISLCILDTTSQKYFKEKTSQKFLDIITNIINTKLVGDNGVEPFIVGCKPNIIPIN